MGEDYADATGIACTDATGKTMRALVQRVSQATVDVEGERVGAKKGVFGACMGVGLVNDGPVTLMVEIGAN